MAKITKKETQEQMLSRIIDEKITGNTVTNCVFNGVNFDAKAVEAITMIAQGLCINATALGDLAKILKSSNVEIETMLKLEGVK